MDIKNYAARIHAKEGRSLDLEFLTHLQKQHVLHIHFENLDILQGIPLSIKEEDLYQKMILHQRGGVCYELNGLFYYFLSALGFKPSLMTGTVRRHDGTWAYENGHLFMIVPLQEQLFLVDVGLGGQCPRKPVPLNGEMVIDADGDYRIQKAEPSGPFFLQKRETEQWDTLYRFSFPSKAWTMEQIMPFCRWTESSPESFFTHTLFLSRAFEEGRMTLLGNQLISYKQKQKIKKSLNEEELKDAALQHFQLQL